MKRRLLWAFALTLLATTGFAQTGAVDNGLTISSTSRETAGAAFLTRIRLADPHYRVILMACLKENELNLLLSRHVTKEEVPVLVKGLAKQLSRALPGQDLSVVAFRPVVPLREAGVGRLNAATGEIRFFVPDAGG